MTCGSCGAEKPVKKCSKSHTRCKGKLFCNKTCEFEHHKKEKEAKEKELEAQKPEEAAEDEENAALKKELEAVAKAEKAKLKKAKKQAKKENKSKGDGEFWWNNSVYASW